MVDLSGKRAVVTGGGRGIGAAIARALSRAGASVIVAARKSEQIEDLAEELRSQGRRAVSVTCDVTAPDAVRGLLVAAERELEGIDILINNAGVSYSAPVRSLSLEDWNRVLSVNATGTFLCTQAFVQGMVDRQWGRIVNIASTSARTGAKYFSAYAASKHAVLGFTRSIAHEVIEHGVTVNAVCPGYVDTDMTREIVARIMRKTGRSEKDALDTIIATNPQRRLIRPEEVADLVLWLCSEGATSVSGQAIVMDGGDLRT